MKPPPMEGEAWLKVSLPDDFPWFPVEVNQQDPQWYLPCEQYVSWIPYPRVWSSDFSPSPSVLPD